jgi:hypothetical protein
MSVRLRFENFCGGQPRDATVGRRLLTRFDLTH